MPLVLTAGPAVEPVTLAEAKAHLRVDGTAEDTLIASLIVTSRLHVEAAVGLALITQSWSYFLDAWPPGPALKLPLRPVQSIAAVRLYDENAVVTTLGARHLPARRRRLARPPRAPGRACLAQARPRRQRHRGRLHRRLRQCRRRRAGPHPPGDPAARRPLVRPPLAARGRPAGPYPTCRRATGSLRACVNPYRASGAASARLPSPSRISPPCASASSCEQPVRTPDGGGGAVRDLGDRRRAVGPRAPHLRRRAPAPRPAHRPPHARGVAPLPPRRRPRHALPPGHPHLRDRRRLEAQRRARLSACARSARYESQRHRRRQPGAAHAPAASGLLEILSARVSDAHLERELREELQAITQSGRAADPEARRDALERAVRRIWGAPL